MALGRTQPDLGRALIRSRLWPSSIHSSHGTGHFLTYYLIALCMSRLVQQPKWVLVCSELSVFIPCASVLELFDTSRFEFCYTWRHGRLGQ